MPTEGRKKLVVCADDYALTPGVSRAIRELIAARRISATSVMTVAPYWADEGPALAAVAGEADIGLHLTLTDQVPLGPMPELAPSGRLPSVGAIVRASLLGRLPLSEIEAEIERQLAAFVTVWKRAPAHVDGHHHVHQLPGILTALMNVLARQSGPRPYLRSCREPLTRIFARGVARRKAAVISMLGAGFGKSAAARGFATNDGFSGIYNLSAAPHSLDVLFAQFVRDIGPRPLMMCHPGYSDGALASLDIMTVERNTELAFLAGDGWVKVLAGAGVDVAPFGELPVTGRP